MDNNQKDGFNLTYSARQQDEVRKIREKYLPCDQGEQNERLEKIRKLDRSVNVTSTVWSIMLGTVGSLIMGIGMCFAMVPEFSSFWGLEMPWMMIVGIPVGIVGMVMVGVAYPVYKAIYSKMKKKVAPEILRLTEELVE